MTDKIDINDIIRKSISTSGISNAATKETIVSESKTHDKEVLNESYIAEPKKYGLVTDFLTQKSKDAHLELYANYIETLNKVAAELDTASTEEANARHSEFRSLKLDETYNKNAVWLHELFFANCFDPHSEVYMDSMSYMRLERDFGGFEKWQKCFMACALSCGEGWAVTGYDMFLKKYVCIAINHHSDGVPIGFYPVVVVDMWSHSYWKDYLTDKKNYLVAMLREINWTVVEDRFNKAEKIAGVLK